MCKLLWPLHGTPLIARVAVLTVDVEHEGVLDGLQRHGGVERLAPQRAAVVLDARPVLEQRHVLLLQPGVRYTSVCIYLGPHNNNCSVTICLAASS